MDNFEYSIQLNEREWAEFLRAAEECSVLPASLAAAEEHSGSDIEQGDTRARDGAGRAGTEPAAGTAGTAGTVPRGGPVAGDSALSSEDEAEPGSAGRLPCDSDKASCPPAPAMPSAQRRQPARPPAATRAGGTAQGGPGQDAEKGESGGGRDAEPSGAPEQAGDARGGQAPVAQVAQPGAVAQPDAPSASAPAEGSAEKRALPSEPGGDPSTERRVAPEGDRAGTEPSSPGGSPSVVRPKVPAQPRKSRRQRGASASEGDRDPAGAAAAAGAGKVPPGSPMSPRKGRGKDKAAKGALVRLGSQEAAEGKRSVPGPGGDGPDPGAAPQKHRGKEPQPPGKTKATKPPKAGQAGASGVRDTVPVVPGDAPGEGSQEMPGKPLQPGGTAAFGGNAAEIPGIPAAEIPGIPAAEIPGIPENEIPGIPANEIPGITAAEIPRKASEIPAIPAAEIPGIPENEIPGIPANEIPRKASEIPGIPAAEIPGIPENEIPGIPENEIPRKASEIPGIPAAEIPGIPENEIPGIPENEIPGIPAAEIPRKASEIPAVPAAEIPRKASEIPAVPAAEIPRKSADEIPSKASELPEVPAAVIPRKPAAGIPWEPAAGIPRIPAVGIPWEPAPGILRSPAIEIPRIPAAEIPRIPAIEIPCEPAAGIPVIPGAGIPPIPGAGIPPIPGAGIPPIPGAGVPWEAAAEPPRAMSPLCFADGASPRASSLDVTWPEMYEYLFCDSQEEEEELGSSLEGRKSPLHREISWPELYEYFFNEPEGSRKKGKAKERRRKKFSGLGSAGLQKETPGEETVVIPVPDVYEHFHPERPQGRMGWRGIFSLAPASEVKKAVGALRALLQRQRQQGGGQAPSSQALVPRRSGEDLALVPLGGAQLWPEDADTALALRGAAGDPRVLSHKDMCLVFCAFASWAVKTSDLQAPDAWKTMFLASFGTLSAIRYFRRQVREGHPRT